MPVAHSTDEIGSASVRVAILGGTGALGFALARRIYGAGMDVIIGSRDPVKAINAANSILNENIEGAGAIAGMNLDDATAAADVVFLTIPYAAHRDTLSQVADALGGKILVDATVPLIPPKVGTVQLPLAGCAALEAAAAVGPHVSVVSALQNIGAEKLGSNRPIDAEVLVCGDNAAAVETVRAILACIGLQSWAAGPLANSAATEAMTSLLIQINRKHKLKQAGIRICHDAEETKVSKAPALSIFAVPEMPLFEQGQPVGFAICSALDRARQTLVAGDVVVVAQKIISKSEGRQSELGTVTPSAEAEKLASVTGKDARYIQIVLDESCEIMRAVPDLIIARHRSGHVAANAGVDMSNIEHHDGEPNVLCWPDDASRSAEAIRQDLQSRFHVPLAVIISDSLGRAWRVGTSGTAIGVAGMKALRDRRGETDLYGRTLEATITAIADEIAAAASLVIGEGNEGTPVAVVRGAHLEYHDGFGETDLLRATEHDLFR